MIFTFEKIGKLISTEFLIRLCKINVFFFQLFQGTPGGEPKVLLNALKPMLGVVGDIKTSQEVLRVIG